MISKPWNQISVSLWSKMFLNQIGSHFLISEFSDAIHQYLLIIIEFIVDIMFLQFHHLLKVNDIIDFQMLFSVTYGPKIIKLRIYMAWSQILIIIIIILNALQ